MILNIGPVEPMCLLTNQSTIFATEQVASLSMLRVYSRSPISLLLLPATHSLRCQHAQFHLSVLESIQYKTSSIYVSTPFGAGKLTKAYDSIAAEVGCQSKRRRGCFETRTGIGLGCGYAGRAMNMVSVACSKATGVSSSSKLLNGCSK